MSSTTTMVDQAKIIRRRIRCWLLFFMTALIFSGLTAIPIPTEARLMDQALGQGTSFEQIWPAMSAWIVHVNQGVSETFEKYPFMFYGTDWLAFAHVMIAIGFIGPMRDPVRNIWTIDFGLICCFSIFPTAFIWGAIRDIPFYWQLIDCSFGFFGAIPLLIVRANIKNLERLEAGNDAKP